MRLESRWGSKELHLFRNSVRLHGLAVLLSFAGSLLSLWRARSSFFWQDDFIFLTKAQSIPFSWQLLSEPLFSHFSPVAWILHRSIVISGPRWGVVQLVMLLVLATTSYLVFLASRVLGLGNLSALVVCVAYSVSIVNIRTMSWWSAFSMVMPFVGMMLIAVIIWSGLQQKWSTFKSIALVGMAALMGASYEIGYLLVIVLAAAVFANPRHYWRGIEKEHRGQLLWTLVLIAAIGLGFLINHRHGYAVIGQGAGPMDYVRSVTTFFGGSMAPGLIGLAPVRSWAAVFVGLALLFAPFAWHVAKTGRSGVRILGLWLIPSLLVAVTVAYARSGFENGSGVPSYPRDLQYHTFTQAWTLMCLALVGERSLGSRTTKRGFGSLVLCLPLIVSPSAEIARREVTYAGRQPDRARAVFDELKLLDEGEYVIDMNTSFVALQFNPYNRLEWAAQLFGLSGKVLSGASPKSVDVNGEVEPIGPLPHNALESGDDWACASTDTAGNARIETMAIAPDRLVLGRIRGLRGELTVNALLGNRTEPNVWPLGRINSSDSSLGFTVPTLYLDRDTVSGFSLIALQFHSSLPQAICLQLRSE